MGKLALVQTTGVTVTPVKTYASMSAVELDAVIQSQMAQCKKLYASLVRHADSLYEALCAMELRFQKQERFRTDLRPLRVQSWYGYLESRGVRPSAFLCVYQRKQPPNLLVCDQSASASTHRNPLGLIVNVREFCLSSVEPYYCRPSNGFLSMLMKNQRSEME